jgi:hypothetical protein
MGLPSSGIISASQIGNYVFNRNVTASFSLNDSLTPGGTDKVYNTILPGGDIWRGADSFQGDIDNPQYSFGFAPTENLKYSNWYGYWKGVSVGILAGTFERAGSVCADPGAEDEAFSTEFTYWGGGYNGVEPGVTVVYTDAKGTNLLDDGGNYRVCLTVNGLVGLSAVGQFQSGIFTYAGFYCD